MEHYEKIIIKGLLGGGEVIEDAWAGSRYRCPACDTVGYWYPS
ncbi:hypothetical protein ACQ5T4_12420 [Vibrio cholerae]